jgi:alkylation response protein AidB-like acyl-CoA dehydrogenase
MDFGFSTDDERMAESVRDVLARDPLVGHLHELTRAGAQIDRPLWSRLAGIGLFGATLDPRHGGSGLGLVETALSVRACGGALAVIPVAETLTVAAALSGFAEPALADDVLPGLADGTTLATVQIPVESGFNARMTATTAEPDGTGWLLTGEARAVPFAADAQLALLPVRLPGPAPQPDTTAMVAVRREDTGVSVHVGPIQADVTFPLGTWKLDRVSVGAERLLRPGAAEHAARVARVTNAVLAVGGAATVMDVTTAYVTTRVQFGQAIGTFQAVRHHAASMRVRLDTAEPAAYFGAWCVDNDSPDADDAGWVGYLGAAASYLDVTKLGIQLHGAIGFTWEHQLHVHLRRAQRIASTFGSMRAGYRRLGRKARTQGVAALTPT